MIVRSYRGRTQTEATRQMAIEGGPPGHVVGTQAWTPGGRTAAAKLFIALGVICLLLGLAVPWLWALAIVFLVIGLVSGSRTKGELTVTWVPAPEAPAPAEPVPAPVLQPDAAARLGSLKAMLDQALISAEEYEAKKADLLSRM